MASDDLPVNIPVTSLSEYFNCPLCECQMRNTLSTTCVHRFCAKCIKEYVNRLHRCPCCNQALAEKELHKDPLFDELMETFNSQKLKAEKEYFDNLIDKANPGPIKDNAVPSASQGAISQNASDIFSPVELVLQKHLKKSLIDLERCCQSLKQDCDRREHQVDIEMRKLKKDIWMHSGGLTDRELDEQLGDVQQTCERQKIEVQLEMSKCVQLIADAYDKYLSEHVPDLAVLPVKVSLSLLSKGITLPDVQLQPFHSVEDIMEIFKSKMIDRGDKIVHLPDDARLISFGPFMDKGVFEMEKAAREVVNHGEHNQDILILPPDSMPLLQYGLKPGSVIALYGKVQCESDLQEQGFATTFQKDAGQKVDSFSCSDYEINSPVTNPSVVGQQEQELDPDNDLQHLPIQQPWLPRDQEAHQAEQNSYMQGDFEEYSNQQDLPTTANKGNGPVTNPSVVGQQEQDPDNDLQHLPIQQPWLPRDQEAHQAEQNSYMQGDIEEYSNQQDLPTTANKGNGIPVGMNIRKETTQDYIDPGRKCNICGDVFKNELGVQIHKGRMHKSTSSKYPESNIHPPVSLSLSYGSTQTTQDNIDPGRKCNICGDVFKNDRGVQIHKGKMHKSTTSFKYKESNIPPPVSLPRSYGSSQCFCGRVFKNEHGLKIHQGKMHK
ncbi:unnamed protein product [Owenia fusiformis]|uniref:Uncharacterized protein n=1 Tax=Owenia fusiformis TaxID=6347 RepID=A0A8J1TU29_OWEFU|nr:unnamed protein product [Owenia fusiformis]